MAMLATRREVGARGADDPGELGAGLEDDVVEDAEERDEDSGFGEEGISRGLKPTVVAGVDVRAEARTYLRNKNNGARNGPEWVIPAR